MRRALALLLSLFAASVLAQSKRPPKLEPLPEPPPPPPMPADEPRVSIPVQKGDKVEEARDATGRIVAVKVTPPGGAPYYLVDVTGTGHWARRDSLHPDFRVPLWLIRTFE